MTTTSPAQAVLSGGDTGWLEDFYQDLHRHPELSHQEHRTASKVAERLGEWDFEVRTGVGGTGVVGVLRNGPGPTVLLRADMDALPVREATGLRYASTVTTDGDSPTPVMHACGHDVHVTCLLGAAQLLAAGTGHWSGTAIALFQPAEETADGARGMVEDGLRSIIPAPDVALAQHVLPLPAGRVATGSGPVLAAADSMRITVHGSGGHGSMPHTTVDPVVVAAMIVVRLQTVVAREVPPGEPVVLTVGSVQAGTKSNVIPDTAVIELNVRTYGEQVRTQVLDAIDRIVRAECVASRCPKEPEFEVFGSFPVTENDHEVTERVTGALQEHFDDVGEMGRWTASEDFGDLPAAFDAPSTYWALGGVDPEGYERAARQGRVAQDIPANHSAKFAPVPQPTLDAGTRGLVVAALAYLKPEADR
ncbi:amidohydrolase [Saccharopolyspora gloriosae]|uniref:amidohydrolase n=1 Tax=Saccharopolyspora gloriosae TaxID=455344 RepID=UPI001FB7A2E8|nr:amidohydrolase [Saccharopolyspora gloriosae]